MLGKAAGLTVPASVNRHKVERTALIPALEESSEGMISLLQIGLEADGKMPRSWGSPPDVVQFLAYHVAHEGHHRGQIVMLARQLGHRLPAEITNGLWQWTKR